MIERRLLIKSGAAIVASLSCPAMYLSKAFGEDANAEMHTSGVYVAPGLTYAGIFLANGLGTWKKNGLTTELRQVQGDPVAMASMTNGESAFAAITSASAAISWDKGIRTLTIAAFTGYLATQMTAHNSWLEQSGKSKDSPIEDRLKALKGARIGVSTIGGGPTQYLRYALRKVSVDPERDVKILAVGFGASRMAALRSKQVDVTVGDAPEADQVEDEGFGKLYIQFGHEVPEFRDFPYTVLSVMPALADKDPELVRRIAHSIKDGNDAIRKDVDAAIEILRGTYNGKIDVKILKRAVLRDQDSYPPGCLMTQAMWENTFNVFLEAGMITAKPPAAEGAFWTNRFLT